MKIHSLSITNFRGYENTTKILFNDLTVFVGKNDVGKSTILEALDIFFHDGKGVVKIDKTDVNINNSRAGDEEIIISVVFDELPAEVVIDSASTTTLASEHLLNAENKFEVIKKFNRGGSPKVYIKALHPTNTDCENLLLKKNTELKKIVKDNKIECENQASNVSLRSAIWNHYTDSLQLQEIEIDASKEDAKKIWEKIATYMPVYSLFQSDRKNSDGDSEIQDPLQEAVKQIINDSELQKTLTTVAEEVSKKLKEVSDRTLDKLREMDPAVASSLTPKIPGVQDLKWADVFKKVSISGDEDISINKRGSGVKRLVLLNFFRAEAERRSEKIGNTGVIYAVEEPETSQHAANQRILIQAFKTLARSQHAQVILTTHSGTIVKELNFDNLRLIIDDKDSKQVLNVQPGVLKYPSLNEVNFLAFDEVTEEYHDELYGFLDFQGWLKDYKQGKTCVSYNKLNSKTGGLDKIQLTETEYIRHQIHHPENTHNPRFTAQQLKDSIEAMRAYICTRAKAEGLW